MKRMKFLMKKLIKLFYNQMMIKEYNQFNRNICIWDKKRFNTQKRKTKCNNRTKQRKND